MKKETSISAEHKIATAASDAAKLIAAQAENATAAISHAVLEATKLLALNASEAAKLLSEKSANDHDLLIELRTRMEGLKIDIKEIKEGHAGKIEDHESRLKRLCEWRVSADGKEGLAERLAKLETSRSNQNLWMGGIAAVLTTLAGLLIFHIFKVGV